MQRDEKPTNQLPQLVTGTLLLGLLVIVAPMMAIAQTGEPTLKILIEELKNCKNRGNQCKTTADDFITALEAVETCYQVAPGDLDATTQAGSFLKQPGLRKLITAVKKHACPPTKADGAESKYSEIVGISFLNFKCTPTQREYIVSRLGVGLNALLAKFPSSDQPELFTQVKSLNLAFKDLESLPSAGTIIRDLVTTKSLQALLSTCSKDKDEVFNLTLDVYLGELKGALSEPIEVNVKIDQLEQEFGQKDDIHNLIVLYALAQDAERHEHKPFAIKYLSVAYTAATCKFEKLNNDNKLELKRYERLNAEDPTKERSIDRSKTILKKIQEAMSTVEEIKKAIRKMLVDDLPGKLPAPVCPPSQ
jgi:hypothetical protein